MRRCVVMSWPGSFRVLAVLAVLAFAMPSVPCLGQDTEKNEETGEDSGFVRIEDERPMGVVESDKALVYVVRPASVGYAIKSFFLCDDEILGINKGRCYFFAHVAPGKHVFWSKSENVDALELTVEAGKTYYIQQHVQVGALRARTKLEVLDETEGKKVLEKCKHHTSLTAKGIEKGKEIARDHKENTKEDLERRAKEEEKKEEKE
jgi:hypothetical protein